MASHILLTFFFFNDTATTEIYTLSLHDALPICFHSVLEKYDASMTEAELLARVEALNNDPSIHGILVQLPLPAHIDDHKVRSEEHTSELQSQSNLVCRLLLEKKKKRPREFLGGK